PAFAPRSRGPTRPNFTRKVGAMRPLCRRGDLRQSRRTRALSARSPSPPQPSSQLLRPSVNCFQIPNPRLILHFRLIRSPGNSQISHLEGSPSSATDTGQLTTDPSQINLPPPPPPSSARLPTNLPLSAF